MPKNQRKTIEPSSHPIEKQVEIRSSSLRILFDDDNRDSVLTLSMHLKILGNETRTAYDGEESLADAAAFLPDIVLLDNGLPKLDRYEVCRKIRDQEHGKNIYIIAQTEWGRKEDRERTHNAGFDHHMVKPLDTSVLTKMFADQSAKRN